MNEDDNALYQLHWPLQRTKEIFSDAIAELIKLPPGLHDEAFSMCRNCLKELLTDFIQIENAMREVY